MLEGGPGRLGLPLRPPRFLIDLRHLHSILPSKDSPSPAIAYARAHFFHRFFCTARADFALGIAPAPPKIERFLPRVVKKTRGILTPLCVKGGGQILTPIEPQRISQTMQPSWAGGIPSSRARTKESIKSLQESSPYRQMTLKKNS